MDIQDIYLSIMQYLNNVCIALLDDVCASSNPLHSDFRSAIFDYFMWLDHHCDGFHDQWHSSLAKDHEITFEGVKNRECSDILCFCAWLDLYFEVCVELILWCSGLECISWEGLQYH